MDLRPVLLHSEFKTTLSYVWTFGLKTKQNKNQRIRNRNYFGFSVDGCEATEAEAWHWFVLLDPACE